MNYITLNNGVKMPQLGYGVYQVTKSLFRIFTKEKKGSKIREKEKR